VLQQLGEGPAGAMPMMKADTCSKDTTRLWLA
jgi:hypothetical protein